MTLLLACPMAHHEAVPIAPSSPLADRSPYVAYTDVDILRELIHPRSSEPLETTFIVVTQVMEMHFFLLAHEWALAHRLLADHDVAAALEPLRRSVTVQRSLLASWEMFELMSPVQYSRFRDQLGQASGFQSYGYRELELLLGVKDEHLLRPHRAMTKVHARLQELYRSPSLFDNASAVAVARTGAADVESAWHLAYQDGPPGRAELAQLAEVLVGIADHHQRWRFVHYQAVRRILGDRPGTAGSSGVSWLKRAVDEPIFPILWQVRSQL